MPEEVSDPMTDNAALNAIADSLESIDSTVSRSYDSISGDVAFSAVSDSVTHTRAADPTSRAVIVSNKGPSTVKVMEDGIIIGLIPALTSLALPLAGVGAITVNCFTAGTSEIAIATFQKAI